MNKVPIYIEVPEVGRVHRQLWANDATGIQVCISSSFKCCDHFYHVILGVKMPLDQLFSVSDKVKAGHELQYASNSSGQIVSHCVVMFVSLVLPTGLI